MSTTSVRTITVTADSLRDLTTDLFARAGMPAEDAAFMGACLTDADLRGVP